MALNFTAAPNAPILGTPGFDTDTGAFLSWMAETTGIIASIPGYLMGTPTIYNSAGSGTYTVPVGAVALMVELLGGGGGGGGATSAGGGAKVASGASSGAYIIGIITTLAASYSYTVGAAGAGGSAGADGSSGGTTSFGAATAAGGLAGLAGATVAAVNVTAANNAILAANSGGIMSKIISSVRTNPGSAGFKLSASNRASGAGGGSPWGVGGPSLIANAAGTLTLGTDATGEGAGGSGGLGSDVTGAAGGAGAPGRIKITPLY